MTPELRDKLVAMADSLLPELATDHEFMHAFVSLLKLANLRRPMDSGAWRGTETELLRLAMLILMVHTEGAT